MREFLVIDDGVERGLSKGEHVELYKKGSDYGYYVKKDRSTSKMFLIMDWQVYPVEEMDDEAKLKKAIDIIEDLREGIKSGKYWTCA